MGSDPEHVKQQTTKLVFTAFCLSIHH